MLQKLLYCSETSIFLEWTGQRFDWQAGSGTPELQVYISSNSLVVVEGDPQMQNQSCLDFHFFPI